VVVIEEVSLPEKSTKDGMKTIEMRVQIVVASQLKNDNNSILQ
jgi:hypothetical protein